MRLVFFGTPDFAVPSLRLLLSAGHAIQTVVTQPDRPRRRQSSPPEASPVRAEAVRNGLSVMAPESIKEPGVVGRLKRTAPEAIVVVAYGQILPPAVLEIPRLGCINLHASLLPKYRGAAPIARAIMAGEQVTGATTMKMDRGLDTGDILLRQECAIRPDETAGELASRLADLGAGLLVRTLEEHSRGALRPIPQDDREATHAPSLSRLDGEVDWSRPAEEIVNRIRGCNPWPLAASFLDDKRVAFLRAEIGEPFRGDPGGLDPGRVTVAQDALIVQCGGASRLRVLLVQLPGRRPMSAREAVNGRLIRAGDLFANTPAKS